MLYTDNKRIYGLDILRAIAIVRVMMSHGDEYSSRIVDVKYYTWLTLDGVGLFFVLSGFLIGGILIRTIQEKGLHFRELRRFWMRRWLRTLPNYYLILTIVTCSYYYIHHEVPAKLFQYITFTQCFASPHPLFFGEAWSLAVEEWFYLLIPAGFAVVSYFSKGSKTLLSCIIAVLIAGTLVRVFKVAGHDYFSNGSFGVEISKQVITRMDSIMYGVLGACFAIYYSSSWSRYKNGLFILGLVLVFGSRIAMSYSLFFYSYLYYSISAMGALCLLPKLSDIKKGKGWVYEMVTFISVISYSMYLTNHMIVERGIMPRLLKTLCIDPAANIFSSTAALGLFWVLTIILSYLLYRFWERPIMRLRKVV